MCDGPTIIEGSREGGSVVASSVVTGAVVCIGFSVVVTFGASVVTVGASVDTIGSSVVAVGPSVVMSGSPVVIGEVDIVDISVVTSGAAVVTGSITVTAEADSVVVRLGSSVGSANISKLPSRRTEDTVMAIAASRVFVRRIFISFLSDNLFRSIIPHFS